MLRREMNKFWLYILSVFGIVVLLVALIVGFYLKGLPYIVSNDNFINYVEKVVSEQTGAEFDIEKPVLKTGLTPDISFKVEKVSLKYGEAKSMPVDITAPKLVPENCEYDVKVKIDSPDGVLVIGSIVNDRIVFPHSQKKDVFKSVKSDVLERVVRANNNGNNEYVSATIGITRASIEPPKVMFKMTGMAFVMSRVNIINENKDTDIKELVNETK